MAPSGMRSGLIPSNKILAQFDSTLEAWPAIIRTIEAGRSPRTLSLDWVAADGRCSLDLGRTQARTLGPVQQRRLDAVLESCRRGSPSRRGSPRLAGWEHASTHTPPASRSAGERDWMRSWRSSRLEFRARRPALTGCHARSVEGCRDAPSMHRAQLTQPRARAHRTSSRQCHLAGRGSPDDPRFALDRARRLVTASMSRNRAKPPVDSAPGRSSLGQDGECHRARPAGPRNRRPGGPNHGEFPAHVPRRLDARNQGRTGPGDVRPGPAGSARSATSWSTAATRSRRPRRSPPADRSARRRTRPRATASSRPTASTRRSSSRRAAPSSTAARASSSRRRSRSCSPRARQRRPVALSARAGAARRRP